MSNPSIDLAWFNAQVKEYAEVQLPRYKAYSSSLEEVLKATTRRIAPSAMVQARPKSIPSFAEKILRKGYKDPLNQSTDLCGARVITHTLAEVEAICVFIRDHFEIDVENSVDSISRL